MTHASPFPMLSPVRINETIAIFSNMQLVTYTRLGVPSIGVQLKEGILDIPEAASRFGRTYHIGGQTFPRTMLDLLKWESGLDVVKQIVESYQNANSNEQPLPYPSNQISLSAPIQNPGKIVALGLNYRDHIQEAGHKVPEFPVVFAKFPSSIVGPGEPIVIPKISKKIDWEVELGIVMGRACKDVNEDESLSYVAGYTIIHDVSARDLQKSDGQWIRAKSIDTFCPMGPCITTTDEIGDASDLDMYTKVNGQIKQKSSTSDLLYGVRAVVSYLSRSFKLEPGDIIATGTPSGVGFTRDPPEFLEPGDEVELFIEGIGKLINPVQ
ncbi:FAA hydrolase family protein [Candidatus Thorarchaeota archaeon]|nr:MAG: FAA hydrolase family protein [Candidatus Thorarchaeota archaeon]